jgi:predicted RecB family endonuclease
MPTARQARGRRTQVVIAAWLREHGWPTARAPVGAETGQDIKGLEDVSRYSIEIKARADFDPLAWMRQAQRNAKSGQRPCVVIRCNGQGEMAADYLVIQRLEDHELNLMRDVGRDVT